MNNRIKRSNDAYAWADKMDKCYPQEIADCIDNTKIYQGSIDVDSKESFYETRIIRLVDKDSVSALFDEKSNSGKIAVLNFASYKNPGGGFLKGSMAQEEALCHESYLFNILEAFDNSFYEYNRTHSQHRGLYENRMLYSPEVRFIHYGKTRLADVITCAAPNYSVGLKYGNVSEKENHQALESRIRFICDAAEVNHVDTLILGAYGCGVFKQNPREVASIFKECLRERYHFKKVIFAVPDEESNNYKQMRTEISN